ncbi:MAG: hypothetical protein ACM3U2_17205 [Deltaproteobacteria bacterium]
MRQISVSIPERFRPGLAILLTAYDYAQDSRTDAWQFAVEFPELLSSGATLDDVRWLIHRGFAEHAKETTVSGDDSRSFRPLAPTCFPPDACLVLTFDGATTLRSVIASKPPAPADGKGDPLAASPAAAPGSSPVVRITPEWDPSRRELRYKGRVVKRYRVPARNQALILTAFQEDDWPAFIDDPIPPEHGIDPKHRLNVTIKSLNRNQLHALIRFHGNGNGLQVYWEAVEPGS